MSQGPVPAGLLVVDKPGGMTSHDVVSRVRRLARTRKVGHAGTLDPMATGVLVLGIGRATRLLGHLALTSKAYDATVRLGVSTTTDDAEGELVTTAPAAHLHEAPVREAAAAFVGDILQVPSSVSAVKVGGRRAYDRVRAGEQVELAARPVTVTELVVHAVKPVDDALDVRLSVRCSSGTYVRAIARDLGSALGVGGHLTALRRTEVGPVSLADATTLAAWEEAGTVRPMPMPEVAARFFAVHHVEERGARAVTFGRPLDLDPGDGSSGLLEEDPASSGPVAVVGPDGAFLALYERAGGRLTPVAVLTDPAG